MKRRAFLGGVIAGGALVSTARPSLSNVFAAQRKLARVKVAANRVIREMVGLRPYRPSGFVVSAERLGPKLLVHNYGHGGGGVTLSWGTATLATELARTGITSLPRPKRGPRQFAVLGCGVSGLSTARLIQRYFQTGPGTVTIYAKDLPPNTTSNVAGASWSPTSVFEDDQITDAFDLQFQRACQISGVSDNFKMLVPIYVDFGKGWTRLGAARMIGNSTVEIPAPLPQAPKKVTLCALDDVLYTSLDGK